MPCIADANVHFATTVATPNSLATAYLGFALGLGQSFAGVTPDTSDLIMDQMVAATRMDSTTKKFALALTSAEEDSYMDFGTTTTLGVTDATKKGTI